MLSNKNTRVAPENTDVLFKQLSWYVKSPPYREADGGQFSPYATSSEKWSCFYYLASGVNWYCRVIFGLDNGMHQRRIRMGVITKPFSEIFSDFHNYGYIGHLLNILFIFDRCHSSIAAVVPVKYEHDLTDWNYNSTKPNLFPTEILTNRALVTPTPCNYWCQCWVTNHVLILIQQRFPNYIL